MATVQRLLGDLRRRRNLDAYLTIGAALTVSALAFFEVVPGAKLASLTLAVLAILAFSSLTTRLDIEDVVNRQGTGGHALLSDFPAELRPRREASPDIYLIGVDLARTIETSYAAFAENLRRGGRIRILLTDPEADDAAVDARCKSSRPHVADLRGEIRHSLRTLTHLRESTGGRLELRTTRAALKFGLNYVDTDRPAATLYVQLYSYRLPGESRPMFTFTRADGEWFDCFRDQAEALWDEAAVFDPARLTER